MLRELGCRTWICFPIVAVVWKRMAKSSALAEGISSSAQRGCAGCSEPVEDRGIETSCLGGLNERCLPGMLEGSEAETIDDLKRILDPPLPNPDRDRHEQAQRPRQTEFPRSEHILRIRFCDTNIDSNTNCYPVAYVFDDLWSSTHPDMAKSLHHLCNGWDCLLPWAETESIDKDE